MGKYSSNGKYPNNGVSVRKGKNEIRCKTLVD